VSRFNPSLRNPPLRYEDRFEAMSVGDRMVYELSILTLEECASLMRFQTVDGIRKLILKGYLKARRGGPRGQLLVTAADLVRYQDRYVAVFDQAVWQARKEERHAAWRAAHPTPNGGPKPGGAPT
jgi:hypothetical protein